MLAKILTFLVEPKRFVQFILRRCRIGSFPLRLRWESFERTEYAYGLFHAARSAKALGLKRITAIEFGVAGGRGLLEMERLAVQIKKLFDVDLDLLGFDRETGLPVPQDYRDQAFAFKEEWYRMDVGLLKSRLRSAKLVLGDVRDTVPSSASLVNSPIGFVSFDLDYYSATTHALKIFDLSPDLLLPRVFCLFDTIVTDDFTYNSPFVGDLLAINEFNERHRDQKLSKFLGIYLRQKLPARWHENFYILHNFNHQDYNQFLGSIEDDQLPLDA